MGIASFIATVIFISLSGVLMPGPLLATTLAEGRKNRFAGLVIASGHAMVEIPIIIFLFTVGRMEMGNEIKAIIGLAGGVALIYFAFSALHEREVKMIKGLLAGIVMSSLNPYFIMWWLTVGFTLAIKATLFGFAGLIALIIFHEMCDFTWYGFVSIAASRGAKFRKMEKILLSISFSIMLFFGIYFIYDSIRVITGI